MMSIIEITSFFGWCTVVNFALYTITVSVLLLFKASIKNIHSKLTGVATDKLDVLYFNYLGQFKLAILIFSLTPYLALKLMGA